MTFADSGRSSGIDRLYKRDVEEPCPRFQAAMLDRRNDGVFRPIIVRNSNENRRSFGHRSQNRPYEELFVANEDRCPFMTDLYRSGAVEIQGNAVGCSRFP